MRVEGLMIVDTDLYFNKSISTTFVKSHKKGFITKKCIVMDKHLNFTFRQALHFSKLAIKLFNSGKK